MNFSPYFLSYCWILLSFTDVLTTTKGLYGLERAGYELNPIMNALLLHVGGIALLLKLLVVFVASLALIFIAKRGGVWRKGAVAALFAANLMTAGVVLWNAMLLASCVF